MVVRGAACTPIERSKWITVCKARECRNPLQRKSDDAGGVQAAKHRVGRSEWSRDGKASRRAAVLYTGSSSSKCRIAVQTVSPNRRARPFHLTPALSRTSIQSVNSKT
eukprot:1012941-Rhodomonas_salina.1